MFHCPGVRLFLAALGLVASGCAPIVVTAAPANDPSSPAAEEAPLPARPNLVGSEETILRPNAPIEVTPPQGEGYPHGHGAASPMTGDSGMDPEGMRHRGTSHEGAHHDAGSTAGPTDGGAGELQPNHDHPRYGGAGANTTAAQQQPGHPRPWPGGGR